MLWSYANGYDQSTVKPNDYISPIKSIGHGITTTQDLRKVNEVWPIFLELSQDIGHKLRVHQKCACGIAIHIRDNTLFQSNGK